MPGPSTTRNVRGQTDGRTVAGRQSGRLSDRVRQHVHEQIVSGALKPGTVILTSTLAKELNVSRMPAREALLALQNEGVVEVIPNRGFIVRHISLADVSDVYVMRRLLEGASSERAATRITAAELDALNRSHGQLKAVADSSGYDRNFDELCHTFHRDIAAASRSARLLDAIDAIFGDVARLQSIGINPPSRKSIVAEHDDIVLALTARDVARARATMEQHVDTLRQVALAGVLD